MHRRNYIVAGTLVGFLLVALGECAVCPFPACPMAASATVVWAAQMGDCSASTNNCCQKMNTLNDRQHSLVVQLHSTQVATIENANGLATLAECHWLLGTERQRWRPTVALYAIDRSLRI